MVGEIRDPETAQIAIQSALTGHLVFTTVHANNVIDVLGRFLNMGVEAYQFVSALNCVLAQRLVRRICAALQAAGDHRARAARRVGDGSGRSSARTRSTRAAGCIECGGTGFKGRTAICELMDLTDRIRDMILERRPTSEIKKAARDEGMTFLRQCAVDRVLDGDDDAARDQQGDVRRVTRRTETQVSSTSWFAPPPPSVAIEIASRRVTVAELGRSGGTAVVSGYATEPLPDDAVTPALTGRQHHPAGRRG